MTETTDFLSNPDSLILADSKAFEAKVASFTNFGADNMHAVFDFDRTLTVKNPGSNDEVTTWHILREHLPKDGKTRYQELFVKYRALELKR